MGRKTLGRASAHPSPTHSPALAANHPHRALGWDSLQRHRLHKAGAPENLLPSDDELAHIRQLSSRESTVCLLPQLVAQLRQMGIHAVGETRLVRSLDEVSQALASWQRVVCKSLWSCSGRGVFVIDGATTPSDTGRLRRLLREQGGVEVQKGLRPPARFCP